MFEGCKRLPRFDVLDRTKIVDREKSINTTYRKVIEPAKLFLDRLYVKKNVGPKLGSEKAVGLSLYTRAVCARSQVQVENIILQ